MEVKKISKIGQGAEGIVYKAEVGNRAKSVDPGDVEASDIKHSLSVIKERVSKSYRLPEIDLSLRKFRTRREAKILEKLSQIGFDSPKLILMDDENMTVEMGFIEGDKLRDVLSDKPEEYSREIGRKLAILHNAGIIHGDLTTSNMILDKNKKVHLIDFGLSFFSNKVEDKAVDLHLVMHALESKHYAIFSKCFAEVIKEYKKEADDSASIIKRLEIVEMRGRNKEKA
ncbi:MAG: KEOPS complex kinase/ATPase Bud32 [Nanoarchaeota archaeon]|nr:KEOPS complex kinase/ATPase Bud32 [Nanoarchaeota archaeon]